MKSQNSSKASIFYHRLIKIRKPEIIPSLGPVFDVFYLNQNNNKFSQVFELHDVTPSIVQMCLSIWKARRTHYSTYEQECHLSFSNAYEIVIHRPMCFDLKNFGWKLFYPNMFSIFRATSRRLLPNFKSYPVRQASNLFEPDYLAVSFSHKEICHSENTKNCLHFVWF